MWAWISSPKPPSLGLLWRLTIVPAVLLLLTVVGSLILVLSGVTISDDRLSAVWVLLAALLGTLGAFAAALLTAGNQEQAHALQKKESNRTKMQVREAGERLRLEATIEGIKLLDSDRVGGGLAAGALATVTRLGHLDVALRMLAPLLENKNVDRWTVAWMVDQALRDPHDVEADSKVPTTIPAPADVEFAAGILLRHSAFFLSKDVDGIFVWPPSCTGKWPQSLHGNAGALVLYALVDLITTESRDWWTAEGGHWNWFATTLVAALRATRDKDPDEDPARIVPPLTRLLLNALLKGEEPPPEVAWLKTESLMDEIEARSEQDVFYQHSLQTRLDRLERWLTGEGAEPPPAAEVPVLPGGASPGMAATLPAHE